MTPSFLWAGSCGILSKRLPLVLCPRMMCRLALEPHSGGQGLA